MAHLGTPPVLDMAKACEHVCHDQLRRAAATTGSHWASGVHPRDIPDAKDHQEARATAPW